VLLEVDRISILAPMQHAVLGILSCGVGLTATCVDRQIQVSDGYALSMSVFPIAPTSSLTSTLRVT
jgi:hypothetical protein